jgi:hypothetical protein
MGTVRNSNATYRENVNEGEEEFNVKLINGVTVVKYSICRSLGLTHRILVL